MKNAKNTNSDKIFFPILIYDIIVVGLSSVAIFYTVTYFFGGSKYIGLAAIIIFAVLAAKRQSLIHPWEWFGRSDKEQ